MNHLDQNLGFVVECPECGLRHMEPLLSNGEILCPYTDKRVRPERWIPKPTRLESVLRGLFQIACWHKPVRLPSLAWHFEDGDENGNGRAHVYSKADEVICRRCNKTLSTAFYTTDTHVLAPYPNMDHAGLNTYERDMGALPITEQPKARCDFSEGEDE